MGTRLYIDADIQQVASCLGIGTETITALEVVQRTHPACSDQLFDAIQNHPDQKVAVLDSFLTFGWGKLRAEAWKLVDGEEFGTSSTPEQTWALMQAQQVPLVEAARVLAKGLKVYWG